MKTIFTALAATVIALGFAASGRASTVKYDYDRDAEFSNWKTFAWMEPARPDASMTDTRIRKAVETGFTDRGFTPAERSKADFLITCRTVTWRDLHLDETPYAPRFGRSIQMNRVAMGGLVVSVIDPQTGKMVWQGTVTDELASNPEQADKRTAKAIEKLLKQFPPKERREEKKKR